MKHIHFVIYRLKSIEFNGDTTEEFVSIEQLQDAVENMDLVVSIAENPSNLAGLDGLNRENKIVLLYCAQCMPSCRAMEQLEITLWEELWEELQSEECEKLERRLEWIGYMRSTINLIRSSDRDYAPYLDENHPEYLYSILIYYVWLIAQQAHRCDMTDTLEELWVFTREVREAASFMKSYSSELLNLAKKLTRQILRKWEHLMGYA
jgi:hypothetical protein